ncbi:MAG: hypothetical protein KDK71_08780 [Chlamydiia bacterium]|nr:hypothetical protein [Chlamydiia bacterium]
MIRKLLTLSFCIPAFLCGNMETKSYTPPLGPLPSNTVDVQVDLTFLLWFASISETQYATTKIFTPTPGTFAPDQGTLLAKKIHNLDWKWSPGSRLGLGIVTNHDGWDLYSSWTRIRNSGDHEVAVSPFTPDDFTSTTVNAPGTEVLNSSWFIEPERFNFNRISGKLTLLYNQIDLELGRAFSLGDFLSARPHVGLRGFWSTLHFDVKGSRPGGPQIQILDASSQNLQNRWGVGLSAGLDTTWAFSKRWAFFAKGDASLTYGRVSKSKKMFFDEALENGPTLALINSEFKCQFYDIQPIIDLGSGIRYQTHFRENVSFLVDIGYEFHYFHTFNKLITGLYSRPTADDGLIENLTSEGDLTFSGLTVRSRIEF